MSKNLKKVFQNNTYYIKNSVDLERVRDVLPVSLLSYDETYDNDDKVSSGYLHFDKVFYISKNNFNKSLIEL